MTQYYAPIELNENTPEPKENGMYLLFCGGIAYLSVLRDSTLDPTHYWFIRDEWVEWTTLLHDMLTCDYDHIQSLATHDAQIRESARHLPLTDKEITVFAKTMFEALGTYGLFACEHDDWREAFDDAFVNAENGMYGLNAVEAGIKAINAKRDES